MTLYKDVNGTVVEMSPEEEMEIMALQAEMNSRERWVAIKISDVKAEAQRRINVRLPEWRQRNLNARATELLKKILIDGTPLNNSEREEMSSGFSEWEAIKKIRHASNLVEQDLIASEDPQSFDIAGSPRW